MKGQDGDGGQAGVQGHPPAAQARITWRAVVRRQNLLHLSIVMAGIGTLLAGVLVAFWLPSDIGLAYMLVGEGLAFILIGIVGIVMSLTTQDVAQGIKDAIREDGDKTREVIGGLRGDIGGLRGDIGRMLEKQDRMLETQNRLLEKQDRMGDALIKVGDTLGHLVENQNRLLAKMA